MINNSSAACAERYVDMTLKTLQGLGGSSVYFLESPSRGDTRVFYFLPGEGRMDETACLDEGLWLGVRDNLQSRFGVRDITSLKPGREIGNEICFDGQRVAAHVDRLPRIAGCDKGYRVTIPPLREE